MDSRATIVIKIDLFFELCFRSAVFKAVIFILLSMARLLMGIWLQYLQWPLGELTNL